MLKSKCCQAEVKMIMSPDFPGDSTQTMVISTCHYHCKQCGKDCDIEEG
jgi:hypothetical protein